MRRRKPWWIKSIYDVPENERISLKSRDGPVLENWWARSFVQLLESAGEKGKLSRAKNCARNGSGSRLRVIPGLVKMGICCTGHSIKDVFLHVPVFTDDVWERLISVVAADAALSGVLLAGDFSEDFADAIKKADIHLVPPTYTSIRSYCSCPDAYNPCIHIGAAWYYFAEYLDENPWELFTIHGMERETVVTRVKEKLDISVSFPKKPIVPRKVDIKEGSLEIPESYFLKDFFCMTKCPLDFSEIQGTPSEITPVRLLGPSPFMLGGKNLSLRIEDLYPVIREYADLLLKKEDEKGIH